tara:strand:+ start:533 stop:658 length:126 start_codon:yes stop_codon:yes gene_type:complete
LKNKNKQRINFYGLDTLDDDQPEKKSNVVKVDFKKKRRKTK